MVTMPLFVILSLIAYVAVKYAGAKLGTMIFGLLVGLSMASTSLGPPVLAQFTTFSQFLAGLISQVGS